MKKLKVLIIFLVFILGFFTYHMKFKSKYSYVIEVGIPYFKEENDVLKIYPQIVVDDDSVDNATIYNVIDKEAKSKR